MSEQCKVTLPTGIDSRGKGFLCVTHDHWTVDPKVCLVGSLLSKLEVVEAKVQRVWMVLHTSGFEEDESGRLIGYNSWSDGWVKCTNEVASALNERDK